MVEEHAVRHSFPVPGFNLIDHCQLSSLTDERDFIIPDTSEMLSTGDWWELIALETSTSRTPILPRKFQVSLAWTYYGIGAKARYLVHSGRHRWVDYQQDDFNASRKSNTNQYIQVGFSDVNANFS
jgi:hypothetical protein